MPRKQEPPSSGSRGNSDSAAPNPAPNDMTMERELIVIARPDAELRVTPTGLTSALSMDTSTLANVLASAGATMRPLFGASEDQIKAEVTALAATTSAPVPDMHVYYRVEAPDTQLDDLVARLREHEAVEAAYVKPPAQPANLAVEEYSRPGIESASTILNDMTPSIEAPPTTPDFTAQQGYLNAAPGGVDARFAWTQPGGSGAGVRIIDIEGGWRFTHEDLLQNAGGVVGGTPSTNVDWVNHGTAVLGEFSGDRNAIGVTGICPDANARAISIFGGPGSAGAITQAANLLGPGDIILIELHRPGPRFNYAVRPDQLGYIAIEWWPDDFAAIRYAASRGVIVVEAAGNGAENLDDPLYDTPGPGFPTTWANPFRRTTSDSGAVVVGAGAPPSGNFGPDRSRLDFSNYGALVDAQGWGREVVTAGYGDLQGGPNQDEWYTRRFSGTSSASPIIVGALGSVQGVLRAHGRVPLTPARARQMLRATGSPQQDAPGRPRTQRVGNRPNLRQLIAGVLPTAQWGGVQFLGNVPAGATRRWFTFNWPAHWHVVWTVVPTTVRPGAPQIKWKVQVERASSAFITYWINITNVSPVSCDIEARFDVLGW